MARPAGSGRKSLTGAVVARLGGLAGKLMNCEVEGSAFQRVTDEGPDIAACPKSAGSRDVSFYNLVGADQQCRWHGDAKRLCGLQIDHQFELGRLFDRQVGRLRTLENLVDEDGGPTIKISIIGPVAQKEARLHQLSLDR